jgi:uncharacterized protein
MCLSLMSASLKRSIAGRPTIAFLLILYPLTWILFLPSLLGKSGFGVVPADIPYQVSVPLNSILGLTGVALLVTRIADGKTGVRALLRKYYHFSLGAQWYVLAVFGAPILPLVVALAIRGTGALSTFASQMSQLPMTYLLNVLVIATLVSLCEEGGWMAFLTARWQRRWGPVVASLLVAPLFGLVHLPLFFITGGLIDNGRPEGAQVFEYAFYLLILFSVPVRILITWVYNSTGGSLPVVALLHASIDATASTAILANFYPGVDGRLLYVAIFIVAAAVIVITRGRLGYHKESTAGAASPVRDPSFGHEPKVG